MGRAASYVDTLRISTRCPQLAAQRALTAYPRSAWERDKRECKLCLRLQAKLAASGTGVVPRPYRFR